MNWPEVMVFLSKGHPSLRGKSLLVLTTAINKWKDLTFVKFGREKFGWDIHQHALMLLK